ncbi:DoxX family protein [Rhodococcus sp. G-MC3]|uniref:DoxX family protein n=1 Tax=Rhodococcus sp. G-MC3 TaxID=3046209 RepID=UPI0024B90EEF|nr:DoxX family protein [Rhodococcus sp. G-MC3]MDJ0393218.1 DoxX family protein [Rhodococcus sp. G-MC3]
MFIATLIVSIFLAVALTFSAVGKLTKNPAVIPIMEAVGVPADKIPVLAYLEIAGAIGLLVGLFWWPIGVAAAIGVILYFVGAVIAHVRVKDIKGTGPAAFLTLVAVAALVLRLNTI